MALLARAFTSGGTAPLTLPETARRQVLPLALAASMVVHAALLLIKFVPPDEKPPENLNPPLEVVLVNAKSPRKPHKADALAQVNLDGGGNTAMDRRAKSNLPVIADSSETDEVSLAASKVQQLESRIQQLFTQIQSDRAVPTEADNPHRPQDRDDRAQPLDTEDRKLAIARLEAQISKEWERYQKLPKRKFIGARTEGVVYAQYVDEWRQRIERIGTHNFPEEAKRLGQYGSLLITVSIRADGTVEQIHIDRPSGFPVLDRAARRIVELAAPFAAFPPAIRKDYDILSITRKWAFTRTDGLVSE